MKLTGLPSALGNALTVLVLLTADLAAIVPKALALGAVGLIDCFTGSGANTARAKIAWHPQRYATTPVMAKMPADGAGFGELDVPKTLAASAFPLKPDVLIKKAKAVLAAEFGTRAGSDPDALLSDDFQFVAPIVGPLCKREFLAAFGSFKVKDAFPDLSDNSWFQVDPLEPNRVWFISRAVGTHTGPLNFGAPIAPTGRRVESPPQAQSMLFDESGRVYTLTVGCILPRLEPRRSMHMHTHTHTHTHMHIYMHACTYACMSSSGPMSGHRLHGQAHRQHRGPGRRLRAAQGYRQAAALSGGAAAVHAVASLRGFREARQGGRVARLRAECCTVRIEGNAVRRTERVSYI